MKVDKQQLRELLEKATGGEWTYTTEDFRSSYRHEISSTDSAFWLANVGPVAETPEVAKANAELICYLRNHASELLEAAERADTLPDIAAEVVKYHNEHVAPMVREEVDKIKKAAEAQRDRLEKALREVPDILERGFMPWWIVDRFKVSVAEALKEAENGHSRSIE